ncbi:MAG: cytochrome c, partial [Pseudomonadota bacterium]
ETISTLTDRMADRFPKGSNPHPSESLSAIWTNWPDFMRKVSDLKTAADRLRRAQTRSEFAAAFRDVGGTCRSCHKAYRQEK